MRFLHWLGDELRLRTRVRRSRRPRRVLVTYWGSIAGGKPTLGDRLAVHALAGWLRERSIVNEVASHQALEHDVLRVSPDGLDPRRYGVMVFVCGPLTLERGLMRLAHRCAGMPRLAVGVSVLAGGASPLRFYDEVVARDGGSGHRRGAGFDLALSGEDPDALPAWRADGPVLRCLRGAQNEYGPERCRWRRAEAAIDVAAPRLGSGVATVDTVLSEAADSARTIAGAFRGGRLVLTTRLHGALLALSAGVPFVAIDQIAGGAKVSAVLGELGWPFVLDVADVTGEDVERAARQALEPELRPRLLALRRRAIELSRASLDAAGSAVAEWL